VYNNTKLVFLLLLLFVCEFSFANGGTHSPAIDEEKCVDELSPVINDYSFFIQSASSKIEGFFAKRHKVDGFNGSVMVAKDGKVIYSGAYGYSNVSQKDTLTTQTPIQLASVTKTFTASAILQLVEMRLISLDDTLQKFFPEFPYKNITVKLLLTHRSGLSDYIYFQRDFIGKDIRYLTNSSLVDLLISKKPAVRCAPDRMFLYCNTNYALLASIIEKVTGVSYKQYIEEVIFRPLGMYNSFVLDMEDTLYHCGSTCYQAKWKEWEFGFSDGVMGDKGIYSSAEDMLKWDYALRNGAVLSYETLQEAYKPRSLDRYSFAKDKNKNYGYGWRMIKQPDKSYLIYHNGNWHGCNNVFTRDINNGYTIIVLGNKANPANYWTQPVWDALNQLKVVENTALAE
jgi:CubicO group peptidase (beta-lactamase class C family)